MRRDEVGDRKCIDFFGGPVLIGTTSFDPYYLSQLLDTDGSKGHVNNDFFGGPISQHKVILTKENLVKRNWNGNKSCCFCDNKKFIRHLFFWCPLEKIIRRIIHMTFGLEPSKNVLNLFGNWLKDIPKEGSHSDQSACLHGHLGYLEHQK
jgi:hypothetical protein